MKVAKVIKFYGIDNHMGYSQDLHFRMSFWDRLKFLIHGENCVIRVSYELLR